MRLSQRAGNLNCLGWCILSLGMRKYRSSRPAGVRATAFFLTLAFLCFTATQWVEVAHPIEEGARNDEHAHHHQSSNTELFCEVTDEHHHHCLHRQSVVPSIEPLRLIPDSTYRLNSSLPNLPATFLLAFDLRSRAQPALHIS